MVGDVIRSGEVNGVDNEDDNEDDNELNGGELNDWLLTVIDELGEVVNESIDVGE